MLLTMSLQRKPDQSGVDARACRLSEAVLLSKGF
jgi:hypothetical protein